MNKRYLQFVIGIIIFAFFQWAFQVSQAAHSAHAYILTRALVTTSLLVYFQLAFLNWYRSELQEDEDDGKLKRVWILSSISAILVTLSFGIMTTYTFYVPGAAAALFEIVMLVILFFLAGKFYIPEQDTSKDDKSKSF